MEAHLSNPSVDHCHPTPPLCVTYQILEDNFLEVAQAVVAAHDSGDLAAALDGGHDGYKKWVNTIGKAQKRKGKRLFMPMRVAFTVRSAACCVRACGCTVPPLVCKSCHRNAGASYCQVV